MISAFRAATGQGEGTHVYLSGHNGETESELPRQSSSSAVNFEIESRTNV